MLQPSRMLEILGIDEFEELVYRALIETPGASVAELHDSTSLHASRVKAVLEGLLNRGLVTEQPDQPPTYRPTDPAIAIETLILRQQQKLQEARATASKLHERYRQSTQRGRLSDLFEIVRGRDAVAERFAQLQRLAKSEVLTFVKPPFFDPSNVTEFEALHRGVAYRSLYDQASLEFPGILELIVELQEGGEQARAVPSLPLKAAIIDGSIGLIPLSIDEPGMEEGGLVVYSSPVLEAFSGLFDLLWQNAVPITLGLTSTPAHSDLSSDHALVLSLMVAGLKDSAIARRLEVSKSTVERRTKVIVDQLGASTRFQAGYMAARRGWLDQAELSDEG